MGKSVMQTPPSEIPECIFNQFQIRILLRRWCVEKGTNNNAGRRVMLRNVLRESRSGYAMTNKINKCRNTLHAELADETLNLENSVFTHLASHRSNTLLLFSPRSVDRPLAPRLLSRTWPPFGVVIVVPVRLGVAPLW